MRVFLALLAAACLCTQQARADMYEDCDKSCDLDHRIAQCKRVLEVPDASAELRGATYAQLCVLYMRAHILEFRTLEACRQATELAPDAIRYNNLGALRLIVGANKSAIKALNKGLMLNPALDILYYNRALAYDRRGDRKQALADAKQAQRLGDTTAYLLIKKLVRPKLPTRR